MSTEAITFEVPDSLDDFFARRFRPFVLRMWRRLVQGFDEYGNATVLAGRLACLRERGDEDVDAANYSFMADCETQQAIEEMSDQERDLFKRQASALLAAQREVVRLKREVARLRRAGGGAT